jgi:DNA-binding MarR family transcriptional regulator
MQANHLDDTSKSVLRLLYELAQHDTAADAALLAARLALRVADVSRVLLVLDARGLVNAGRARLTMRGLALAARLPAAVQPALPRSNARPSLRGLDRPAALLARCAGGSARS